MKYLITIPASLTDGKKPKIVPAKHMIMEAFTILQVERRLPPEIAFSKNHIVQPLNDWLEAIPTI